jgi:hypothetical protein
MGPTPAGLAASGAVTSGVQTCVTEGSKKLSGKSDASWGDIANASVNSAVYGAATNLAFGFGGKLIGAAANTKLGQAVINKVTGSKPVSVLSRGLDDLVNKGATTIGPTVSKISAKLTNLANKIPPNIRDFFRDPSCGRMSVAAKPNVTASPIRSTPTTQVQMPAAKPPATLPPVKPPAALPAPKGPIASPTVAGTGSGGRLGSPATRAQNRAIADHLENKGWELTYGGGKIKEEYLPGPAGTKGSNYVDITAEKDGMTLRINTVDTYANGTMTTREATAKAMIEGKTGSELFTIPKGSGLGDLDEYLAKLVGK